MYALVCMNICREFVFCHLRNYKVVPLEVQCTLELWQEAWTYELD